MSEKKIIIHSLISGGFAGIWAFLHTGLITRVLRKPRIATNI